MQHATIDGSPPQLLGAATPTFDGAFDADACALAAAMRDGEAALAALPAKPDRDPEQQRRAEALLEHGRGLRARFMQRHAETVYEALTGGRTHYLRLAELLALAAERFPGLAPTAAEMATERGRLQMHKDGREIDLGLITRAILHSPVAGTHLLDAMLRPTARAHSLLAEFDAAGCLDLGSVLLERRNRAAHITIQRPDCLNAEDERLVDDLETAIDLVLLDGKTRVGVLRGGVMTHPKYAGRRVFCSGINLRALRNGEIGLVGFLLTREMGLVQKLRRGVLVEPGAIGLDRMLAKPWVAAVDTFAIGGGMQMLFAFDHVIAEDRAWFSLPAANEGIIPGVANLRITRQTGGRLARRIILSGQRVQATDPDAMLICDQVTTPDAMDAAVEAAVQAMDSDAVVANRAMLNLAEERADDFRRYMAEFAAIQPRRSHSADVIAKLERAWAGRRPEA